MTLIVESPSKKFLSFLEKKGFEIKVLITRDIPLTTEKVPELIEIKGYELGSFDGLVGLKMWKREDISSSALRRND